MTLPVSLLLILGVILATPPTLVQGANILIIAPLATHSHALWFDIISTLLAKEHQVTVLSSDPEKSSLPNRTTFTMENSYENSEYDISLTDMKGVWGTSVAESYRAIMMWNVANCERQAKSRGLADFLETYVRPRPKVDLIIKDGTGSECFLPLVHILGYPPVISATPFPNFEAPNEWIANYDNPAYVPHCLTPYTDQMSILQRAHNAYISIYFKLVRSFSYLPANEELARSMFPAATFGPYIPHVATLDNRVVLAFVNYHPVLDYAKPTVPAFIPVPGLQLRPARPLPQDIQSFLDEAKDGAFVFTFGSSLLTSNISPAYQAMFLKVLGGLKQRVIWKWEAAIPANKPNNVMLAKWLPQADILGHPNTVAFISHCGQAGTQEAIYHGVPVLAIPFIIDQLILAAKLEAKGVAIQLDYDQLSAESIRSALEKLVTPSYGYKERMSRLSSVFRDSPSSSAEKISYWTNYILRHGGDHLTPASKQLTLVQYYLLDVVACVLAVPILLVLLTRGVVRLVTRAAPS